MPMSVSPAGAGFAASSEAIYLYAYPDPVHGWKVPTIGGGHTAAAGGLIPRQGMTISLAEACQMLMQDLNGRYGPRVQRAIKRRLVQNVFDGFTSFDLNTGAISSGSIDEKWNAGDEAAALATLRQYVNAGGVRLAGLVTRRAAEARIIAEGVYPASMVLIRTSPNGPARSVQASSLPWGQAPQKMEVHPEVFPPVPPLPTPAPRGNFMIDIARNIYEWWTRK
jgi:lysozyme